MTTIQEVQQLKNKVNNLICLLENVSNAEDGKSAYQLAIESGEFEGTQEEWFESLRGPVGPIGPTGYKTIDPVFIIPSSITPTTDGTFKPSITSRDNISTDPVNYGTLYPNHGNFRAKEGYDTLFNFENGVWTKSENKLAEAVNSIIRFTNSTFPLIGSFTLPVQRTHDNFIWEVIEGKTALITDVPFDGSLVWRKIGIVSNIKKTSIADYAGVAFASGDIDDSGNVYIATYTANFLGIYKNGVLIKSLASTYNLGLSSIAIKLEGNLIYILLGSNSATASTNGLINIQYNITSETFTEKPLLTTGANEKLTSTSIVKYGSDLYTAVNVDGISDGTSWNLTQKRIDLFKLVGENWVKQNIIHGYNQEWDARFQKPSLVYEDALNNIPIVPINGTLFVNEKGNLGCYFVSNTNEYQYRPFSKELVNNSWIVEYLTNNKGYIIYAWVDKFGKRKVYQKKYYNIAHTWSLSRSIITNKDNKSFLEIENVPDELGMAVHKNGKVIYIRIRNNVRRYIETFELTDEYINSVINIQGINNIGYAYPNTVPPTNIKVGDYFIAKDAGTYQFVDYWELTGSGQSNTYMSVSLGQIVKIIWNGLVWIKEVVSDNNQSPISNVPLKGVPIYNDFGSRAFRIPIITETTKGTLIIGADARRTGASDYAEMDGVICRSGDGGKTWTDYKIVFKRNLTIEGARVHDLGLTVDKNINSPQYGRIWAFAKEWLANVDPVNLQYYVDNPDKSTFWISYSDDDGLTWSVPTERKDLYKAGAWHLSSGCSAGLTMADGTLIQPTYNGYSTTDFRSCYLKKSVGGDWQIGDEIPSSFGKTDENSIIEDLNGKLLMNARTSGLTRKVFELSAIGGTWINKPEYEVFADVVGGCQNSFFRYRNTYLYIQPTPNGTSTRNNIRLYYSFDKVNWQKMVDLTGNDVSGGYSSIIVSDQNFNVLFEKNINSTASISHLGLNYLRNLLK